MLSVGSVQMTLHIGCRYLNHQRIDKMKYAAYLPEDKTLCGLPLPQKVSWGFIEARDKQGMRINKGQQYSLFKESVTCPQCLELGKELVDDICPYCGNLLI
jgi:hypothetical protein